MSLQKYLPVLIVFLGAMFTYTPAAQAQEANCSCQCVGGVDGAPSTTTFACDTVSFLVPSPPPEGCPVETYCPAEPAAPTDPLVPVTPVVDVEPEVPTTPVADNTVAEPPVSGLQCRYRKVYRPDLGKFKKVKVCRLSKEQRTEKRAERRAKVAAFKEQHSDAIARLRAKHQASIAKWKAKHRHNRKGD
jgi:hypothetical protein